MLKRLALPVAGVHATLLVALLICAVTESSWERDGLTRWPMKGEFLTRENGRRLRVWCEGSGPVVVLEATGVGTADQYAKVISGLQSHARVCAYDRAGYGYSDERPGPTTLDALRDDLWAVAQHSGPGPYVWVAGSFGGLPVLYTARSHVSETRAIVLLDAVVPGVFGVLDEPWQRIDRSTQQASRLASLGLLRIADPFKLGDTQSAWMTYRPVVWRSVNALLATRHGAREALDKLPALPPDLPLEVVRHDKVGDMMGPDVSLAEHEAIEPKWQAAQAEFAASSTRGELVVATGVGHYVASDKPDLAVELIDKVLTASP